MQNNAKKLLSLVLILAVSLGQGSVVTAAPKKQSTSSKVFKRVTGTVAGLTNMGIGLSFGTFAAFTAFVKNNISKTENLQNSTEIVSDAIENLPFSSANKAKLKRLSAQGTSNDLKNAETLLKYATIAAFTTGSIFTIAGIATLYYTWRSPYCHPDCEQHDYEYERN